jgi:hypothetical protein
MLAPHIIGWYCIVAGLSMLAGWLVAFRNRPYLGALGVFFLALAASLMIYDRAGGASLAVAGRAGTAIAPGMKWALRGTVLLAVIAFISAVVMAVQETRQRLRDVRIHYQAAAEALMAMSQAKDEQLRREKQAAPPPAPPKGEDQDGKKDA